MEKIIKRNSFKKVIIFVIVLFLACLPAIIDNTFHRATYAETNGSWIDEIDLGSYSLSGDGTEVNPYKINSPEDLAYMSKQSTVNASVLNDKYYVLTNDIDLSQHFFTPIGASDAISQIMDINFNGYNLQTQTYHSISGLVINNNSNNLGLFGHLSYSTVQNLTIAANITSGGVSAGIVAGTINSCVFNNITTNGQLTGTNNNLGGLIGTVVGYENEIINCTNNATVMSLSGSNTGGIFANALSGDLTLLNCTNNADVSGITYVGGLGSGNSNTSTVMTLENCTNNGNITSVSPNNNYFAGLVANMGISLENQINFCKNTGTIHAPNSAYVAGLVAFGKCEITNSYNTGSIVGDTLIGGLASFGVFNITGCYNTGDIESRNLGSNAIAGGLVAKLIDLATISISYNTGDIALMGDGFGAGILACFEADHLVEANPSIIIDSYNLGSAKYGFAGSSNFAIVVENGYDLSLSPISDTASITHSYIYTSGTASEIYQNLSAHSDAWGLFEGFNNTLPYLKSNLVSHVSINLNGGTNDGNYTALYVLDLFDTVSLQFNNFLKTGQTFVGFSTIQNDTESENFIPKNSATFKCSQQEYVLYVQYTLIEYNVTIQTESQFADTAQIYESDQLTVATTISLFSDKYLIATQVGTNAFAYWAIKVDTNLFQISNKQTCNLENIFTEQFLQDYPYNDVSYTFVAVFEQSWAIEIEIVSGDPSWGTLDIVIDGSSTPFNFSNPGFHVTKDVDPTQINFVLSALPYYKISQFSMSAIGDIGGDTSFDEFSFDESSMSRGVRLGSDLKISISFTKQIYHLSFVSVYEDYLETDSSLILSGNNLGFYINQTISGSSLLAQTENLDHCRFIGIKLKKADGLGYSPFLSLQSAGQPDSFLATTALLDTYLDGDGYISVFAIYQKQYKLNINQQNAQGEYGNIAVLINNLESHDFNQKLYDAGTDIKVKIAASDSCYISSIVINNTLHTGNIHVPLAEDLTITIVFEKIRYYLDIYTIDFNNSKITDIAVENLFVIDPKQDSNGTFISYDDNLYIVNNQTLEFSSHMKFIGWYFIKNGEPVGVAGDIDDNLNIIFSKTDLSELAWNNNDKNYITIVAKIINIYVLDVNLSDAQKERGSYLLEIWNETKFDDVDNLQTEFNIGSTIRLTATSNSYFSFAGFEDSYGNIIEPDTAGGQTITFVLDRSQTVSLYFDTVSFNISISKDLNAASGALSVATNTPNPESLKIGDNLAISFAPDSNLQVNSFEINGKTFEQLEADFGGQIMGNSIIINVTSAFLNWLDETDGNLNITVSTGITTTFLIILIGVLAIIIFLAVFVAIKLAGNRKKKKLLMEENLRKAKTRHGFEFKGKLQSLLDEAKNGSDNQEDNKD